MDVGLYIFQTSVQLMFGYYKFNLQNINSTKLIFYGCVKTVFKVKLSQILNSNTKQLLDFKVKRVLIRTYYL